MAPDRPDAADRPVSRVDAAVQPPLRRRVPPEGPPALDSKKWAREFNEVKEIGSSGSTKRTPEQTLAARFWAEAPVQQAHNSFRRFVGEHELDVAQAARFMAMISVTYADALIACFDAKYHYAFWRPVTAIRAGDTDGNDDTVGDPGWSPLLAGTPNHPEYPSAHSCVTPAAGIVIARFLNTHHIDYTVPSLTGLGDRHYATPKDHGAVPDHLVSESDASVPRIAGLRGLHRTPILALQSSSTSAMVRLHIGVEHNFARMRQLGIGLVRRRTRTAS